MNVLKKSPALFILFLVVSIIAFFIYKSWDSGSHTNDKSDENYKSVSSLIILVLDKIKEEDPNRNYIIRVRNAYEPYQEFTISIDDERVWNLISTNQNYFVTVEWISNNRTGNIQGVKTNLAQIEPIDLNSQ